MRMWETIDKWEDPKTKETGDVINKFYEWEERDFSRLCMIITEMHKTNVQINDPKKKEWINDFLRCCGRMNKGKENEKDVFEMVRAAYWKLYKRTLKHDDVIQVLSTMKIF
jgi:hypothetical protein